ncbi:MAG: hypothetical protein NDJ89_15035 [Oligoflexia bacterium]|nr:hypothetical protein [Oligoflexia bacterium]
MSLVETLISLAIMSIVIFGSLSVMSMMSASQIAQQMSLARDEIVTRIKVSTPQSAVLQNSATLTFAEGADGVPPQVPGGTSSFPHFEMFSKCLPDVTSVSGCDRTTMDDTARGNFFYLAAANSTSPDEALAGENIYYSATGRRCVGASGANAEACPLIARVWSEPFCTNFDTACNKATSMIVRFAVGLRPDHPRRGILATREGEIFLSLQKGLQLSRVLDQNSNALAPNGIGVVEVQKFLSLPGQTTQGLRFEVLVSVPDGISELHLEMRALTGPDAYGKAPTSVPPELLAISTWTPVGTFPPIVPTPGVRDQVLVFGSHGGTSLNWPISGGYTLDGSNNPVAPTFKSGFYQFRVAGTSGVGTVESTNYATVRVLPVPQILPVTALPSSLERDCTGSGNLNLQAIAADDEGLEEVSSEIRSSSGPSPVPLITEALASSHPLTRSMNLEFQRSWLPASYTVNFGAKNALSAPVASSSRDVFLSDFSPTWNIESSPANIRLASTGDLAATYVTDSCCRESVSVGWTYPNIAGNSLLSGNASTPMDCSLAGNRRTCSATLTASGVRSGPATGANNLVATLNGSFSDPACMMGSYQASRYVQVLGMPNIGFHKKESLWFNLPTAEQVASQPRPFTNTIQLRADFPPIEDVKVKVVPLAGGSEVCSATFAAGTGTDPVYQTCTLPPGFAGDLLIRPDSSNVIAEGDTPQSSTRAIIPTAKMQHRSCQANLTAHPQFPAQHTVTVEHLMTGSPWGPGNPANDEGLWTVGKQKKLRCYDYWGTTSGIPMNANSVPAATPYSSIQDNFFSVERNREIRRKTDPSAYPVFYRFDNLRFQSYLFPYNGGPYPDFNSRNAPTLFLVARSSSNPSVTWSWTDPNPGGGTMQITKPYTDRTGEFCTGGSSMSETKILSAQFLGYQITGGLMSIVEKAATDLAIWGQIEYLAVCTYGRWTPFGPGSSPSE